jgi:asparagine synthase (glutamine-hydrolysing)
MGEGDLDHLRAMTEALGHRGPDGLGLWIDEDLPIFLGHRRLAVIDIEGGAQPMATPSEDLVVTFNGEIYNHAQIRRQLEARGHEFQTDHSDTEVLLYGYREWGIDMLDYLNGMWAFALFDRTRKTLVLSRDRFGQKPLYYAVRPGLFAFASELSALVCHAGVRAEMSERALQKYFAYGYIPSPLTIYKDVSKLEPGSSLEYAYPTSDVATQRYWRFVLRPMEKQPRNPEKEWADELALILRRSVKRHLVADVDVGIFLSGGMDSSLIATLAAQESTRTISTFNVGFEEPTFDESLEARKVANAIGTEHQTATLSLERSLDLLPGIVGMLDEPLADSSLLPTWLLAQQARRKVKVVLGGDGGDELFAGYDPFDALTRAQAYQRLVPKPVHQAISLLVGRLPVSHGYMSFDFRLKRFLGGVIHNPGLWNPIWMAPLQPADLNLLFGRRLDLEDVYSEAISTWEEGQGSSLVDRVLQFFTDLYLPNDILTKTDRATMMHGLEARAPFLDLELAEFAARIPWTYKYRRGSRKFILKQSANGLLPARTIRRPKQGFGVPVGRWFHEGRLALDSSASIPFLEQETINRFVDEHQAGKRDHRLFLWSHWLLSRMHVRQPGRLTPSR